MDFYAVLEKVLALLQRHKRVTYRALKLHFELDDETLDTLKGELLFAHPVVDEDDRGLVWTGETVTATDPADGEQQFQKLILTVLGLLQCERRVTYRRLKDVLGLDDLLVAALREELTLRRLAVDEANKVLVWNGANGMSALSEALPANAQSDNAAVDTREPTQITPEAERRQLTVMFCDLADSTQLSQQLDPEDLREIIRSYQQTGAEVIERFDGTVAQHLGDGLLVYFGWPQAHEDDAQRALHAGLGIVDAITTTLNPRLQQAHGVHLTVRLGVHTGPVVVGEMGGDGRHENLATGETVNLAARLEALAQPNTVVISSATERLLRGAFTLEDLGTHALKGVAEPMQLYHVLCPAAVHQDEDESMSDGGMFLVGRDEEVGLLLRRWEQNKEGPGQVVLISGEAGIGKSSLVATMRHHVVEAGYNHIAFRCSPYHTNSALYPVITHLEQMLGFARDDTPDGKLDKLEQALRTMCLPLEESVPLLAALLSVPLHDRYPTPIQSSQRQRQQTLDTLVAWLMEASENQPVLAVWEDLHWADPSTLEMLGLVLQQTPTVSMLSVLTFRPEFSPPWPGRSHMTPITLNRLERSQVEALITHLAGDKTLPGEVVEHIVAKTDGVPLYVEELTKMLLNTGLLREKADAFALTGPLLSVSIPDTLQDSLMARLDQLGAAKEIAQIGAVCGREFPYDLLQAISPQDDETLQASLSTLVQAELLYQRGRPPRATYMFKHALLQDAAYASLLRRTRQQIHQRIAQLLETRFPEVVETQPELLAHHYTEAGLNEQAVLAWQQAGEHASRRLADAESIAHITKGLAMLKTLPETAARVDHEIQLLRILGVSLSTAKGQADPAVGHTYTRLLELCKQGENASLHLAALRGLRFYHNALAEHRRAAELGEEGIRVAQRVNDPVLVAEAHHDAAVPFLYRGVWRLALDHFVQCLSITDGRQDVSEVSRRYPLGIRSRLYASLSLWMLGYPDQAQHRYLEALTYSQRQPETHVHVWGALLYAVRREWSSLRDEATRLFELATELGRPQGIAVGTIMLGWWRVVLGQDADSITQLHQGIEDFRDSGGELFRPYWLARLAEAYAQIGRLEDALTILDDAFTAMHTTEEYFHRSELHRLKGTLLLSRSADQLAEAEVCFHRALDVARDQEAKSLELRVATSLARLWQSQGKCQDAYDLLAPVYNWFTEGFDTADLKEARTLLTELA